MVTVEIRVCEIVDNPTGGLKCKTHNKRVCIECYKPLEKMDDLKHLWC